MTSDASTAVVARRRRRAGWAWRRRLTFLPFVLPGVAVFAAFTVWPLVHSFVLSLQRWDGFAAKTWIGLTNYHRLLEDAAFWRSLQHTLIYTAGTLAAKIVFGLGLALLLDRKLRGRAFYRTVVFVPALLSFVMVGLLWQYIYDPTFGLLNRALGTLGITDGHTTWLASAHLSLASVMVVDVWKWVGYHTVLFLAGLSLVSNELREAARIDGANAAGRFWHVTLPAIRGVFIVNVTIAMAGAFNSFDLVYVMTGGGPYGSSEVTTTYLYREAFTNNQFGYASAIACLMFAFVGVLTLAVLRLNRTDYP
jgi:raffinose/stachyose/melibiose transport system permease protein